VFYGTGGGSGSCNVYTLSLFNLAALILALALEKAFLLIGDGKDSIDAFEGL
jgi:hypothetical protein